METPVAGASGVAELARGLAEGQPAENHWRNIHYGSPGKRRLRVFAAPCAGSSPAAAGAATEEAEDSVAFGERFSVVEKTQLGDEVWLRLSSGHFAGKWVRSVRRGEDGHAIVDCIELSQWREKVGRIPDEAFAGQDYPSEGMYTEGYPGSSWPCLVSASGDALWREVNIEMLFRDIATATVFEQQWTGTADFMDWVAYYAANTIEFAELKTGQPKRLLVTVRHTSRWRRYKDGLQGPDVEQVKQDIGNAQYKECSWLKSMARRLQLDWSTVEFRTAFAFLRLHCRWTEADCKGAAADTIRLLLGTFSDLTEDKRAYLFESAFWCCDEAADGQDFGLEITNIMGLLLVLWRDGLPGEGVAAAGGAAWQRLGGETATAVAAARGLEAGLSSWAALPALRGMRALIGGLSGDDGALVARAAARFLTGAPHETCQAAADVLEALGAAAEPYADQLRAWQSKSSCGRGQVPASAVPATPTPSSPELAQRSPGPTPSPKNRALDIQLVGSQGVGKSALLEAFLKEHDLEQLPKFKEGRDSLLNYQQVRFQGQTLRLIDCSGQPKAKLLVQQWFSRAVWVFAVYDLANPLSWDVALQLAKSASQHGAKALLLGNRHSIESERAESRVDVAAVRHAARQLVCEAMEVAELSRAVGVAVAGAGSPMAAGKARPGTGPKPESGFMVPAAMDAARERFGGKASRTGCKGLLRPSLRGTKAMKRGHSSANASLLPAHELQDSESAVSCISFGQERLHKAFILLAAASKNGTVVVYRCYRTEMEIACLPDENLLQQEDSSRQPASLPVKVHARLQGHSDAITSMFFNLQADTLMTTSLDKSLRVWDVDSGRLLQVFYDCYSVLVALSMPFSPRVFITGNSGSLLRVFNTDSGCALQKLEVEAEVRALAFDDTGSFLLAGTRSGIILVLKASASCTLKQTIKVAVAHGGITCIRFVPAVHERPPCLLVNTTDSSVHIIDCTYGPGGALKGLAVRHRLKVAHSSMLTIKCAYSPSDQGYVISGSEDKAACVYSLGGEHSCRPQFLKCHRAPVLAVAVSLQDTLLASADASGTVVLWRRPDFSHLPD